MKNVELGGSQKNESKKWSENTIECMTILMPMSPRIIENGRIDSLMAI